jgi:hypothetical protein
MRFESFGTFGLGLLLLREVDMRDFLNEFLVSKIRFCFHYN